jgi:hypothetical protein
MRYFLFSRLPLALASFANSTMTALGLAVQVFEPQRPENRGAALPLTGINQGSASVRLASLCRTNWSY